MEVRRTLLELSRTQGKTIFVSSHNLDEMQRLCNRIVLIHGRRDQALRRPEVSGPRFGQARGGHRDVCPRPCGDRRRTSRATGATVESQAGAVIEVGGGSDFTTPAVVAFLVDRGLGVEQVAKRQDSLEELYLRIEAEAGGDAEARARPRPVGNGHGEGGAAGERRERCLTRCPKSGSSPARTSPRS